MYPRAGHDTPHYQSQAHIGNRTVLGNLPPSSLAAQIANRLATHNQASRGQDRDSFRSLLGAILDENDHVWEPGGLTSGDAAVNSRLICVVVEAGLDLSHKAQRNDLSSDEKWEICKSFQAIDLIFTRSPSALSQPLEPGSPSGLPLFAWLIPRILLNVRDSEFHDIEQAVRSTIKGSLSIGRHGKLGSRKVAQVPSYVRGLVAGTSLHFL